MKIKKAIIITLSIMAITDVSGASLLEMGETWQCVRFAKGEGFSAEYAETFCKAVIKCFARHSNSVKVCAGGYDSHECTYALLQCLNDEQFIKDISPLIPWMIMQDAKTLKVLEMVNI